MRNAFALATALLSVSACQRSLEGNEPSSSASALPESPRPNQAPTSEAGQRNVGSEFQLLKADGPTRPNWLEDFGSMTVKLEACWSRRRPRGTGSLSIVLSPTGAVESVKLDGPLEDSERACALEAARTFKFAQGDARMTIDAAIRF